MNAIKVHSGHNNTNSINFRGAGSGGGFGDSIRASKGTGMSSDLVYPPDINHKIGNISLLCMIISEFSFLKRYALFVEKNMNYK